MLLSGESSMVKMGRLVKDERGIPHFGCVDHRLEKTAERFYKHSSVESSLSRAKAVVTFIHKSPQVTGDVARTPGGCGGGCGALGAGVAGAGSCSWSWWPASGPLIVPSARLRSRRKDARWMWRWVRRSGGGRGGGWELRLVAVAGFGAADRSVGSASARAAAPGSLAGLPLLVPFIGGSRPARRLSGGGRCEGWGLHRVAVAGCGAAGRPVGSASARAAAPGPLAGLPRSNGVR